MEAWNLNYCFIFDFSYKQILLQGVHNEDPGAPEEFHNKVNNLPLLEGSRTLIIPKNLLRNTNPSPRQDELFTMNVLPALRVPSKSVSQVQVFAKTDTVPTDTKEWF